MKIDGIFRRFIWRDTLSGNSLMSLEVPEGTENRDNEYGTIVVNATVVDLPRFLPVEVDGEFFKTDRGTQLRGTVKEKCWNNKVAIDYLCSIGGIGEVKAKQIVSTFGCDVFTYMNTPDAAEKITKAIKGLSIADASTISRKVRNIVSYRELFEYVQLLKGKISTAKRLHADYGPEAIKILKKDPYGIGHNYGLTFKQCDSIALKSGFNTMDPNRIVSAANEIVQKNEINGNCFIDEDDFVSRTESLISDEQRFPDGLIMSIASANKNFAVEETPFGNRIYSRYMLAHECNIAFHLKRLLITAKKLAFDSSMIEEIEKEIGVTYAPQQREAFNVLKKTGVSIITGGPGTGKTTVINGIIRAYKRMYPNNTIRCCAPTGRASQRMKESTGEESVTVHKLLDYKPYGSTSSHKDSSNPIEADVVIVDESSMLDTELTAIFLSAIKNGTLVIFVGDVDQLQAVGAGDVLHNMIFSNRIPVYRLIAVYRQATTSPIVQNAIRINTGCDEIEQADDFQIAYRRIEQFPSEIVRFVKENHDKKNPFKTQVLSPTKKGEHGVYAMNEILQEILNPKDPQKKELRYGLKRIFREGDKVVMTTNNYKSGYHNGDIGIISSINGTTLNIDIIGAERIEVGENELDDVNLAYAMTVHKSQGSEFQTVIMTLPMSPVVMLKRNLLYTGITRAKKKVILIAENGSIAKSVACDETGKRNTCLTERIQFLCQKGEEE